MGWGGWLGIGRERGGGLRRDGIDADVLVAVIDGGRLGHAYDGVLVDKREEMGVSNERPPGITKGSPPSEKGREGERETKRKKKPAVFFLGYGLYWQYK